MNTQEIHTCDFCKESKPVMRKYVHAGNKNLDDNKQNIFVIIWYCGDCGIENPPTDIKD